MTNFYWSVTPLNNADAVSPLHRRFSPLLWQMIAYIIISYRKEMTFLTSWHPSENEAHVNLIGKGGKLNPTLIKWREAVGLMLQHTVFRNSSLCFFNAFFSRWCSSYIQFTKRVKILVLTLTPSLVVLWILKSTHSQ